MNKPKTSNVARQLREVTEQFEKLAKSEREKKVEVVGETRAKSHPKPLSTLHR